jgi:hypothetical protein
MCFLKHKKEEKAEMQFREVLKQIRPRTAGRGVYLKERTNER